MNDSTTGFALGGLGGFNAHGVGFLQAALDKGVTPDLISCTSGQIYWVWRYLLQLAGESDQDSGKPVDIRAELLADIREMDRLPHQLDWLEGPLMAIMGDPGIFHPAVVEYWQNLFRPYLKFDRVGDPEEFRREVLNRLLPAQTFVPERSQDSLRTIGCRIASEQNIGVMFNAYDVPAGKEVLYLNRRAQSLLQQAKPKHFQHGSEHGGVRIIVLDESDPDRCFAAVDGALWLYLYGFQGRDGQPRTRIDGAYHRQMIIREMAPAAARIYSVRPQTSEWRGKPPENAMEVANFVTQLWFNASYPGEVAQIELINELIDKEHLHPGHRYKRVRLIPVEYEARIRYYEYFVERATVFKAAYEQALDKLS